MSCILKIKYNQVQTVRIACKGYIVVMVVLDKGYIVVVVVLDEGYTLVVVLDKGYIVVMVGLDKGYIVVGCSPTSGCDKGKCTKMQDKA